MAFWERPWGGGKAGQPSGGAYRYRLECKRCGRVLNVGLDAGIMSMDEAVEINSGNGMVTVLGDEEVMNRPDMVVSFNDHPPEDLEHSRKMVLESMKRIEASLRQGRRRKWYCHECGNDDKPYKYPAKLKEEYPPRDGEFLILWPQDLSEFSQYLSRKDQDPFLMTNLRLAVIDAMKLVDVFDIESIDRFERRGIKRKTIEITTGQGKIITVANALTGESTPKIMEELRQRAGDS